MKKIDNRRDIMLLLLYSPGVGAEPNEPIVGRTRFIKALFLFRKEVLSHFREGTEINESNFYEFFPWNFGPFSSQVFDDLTFFVLRNFIKAEDTVEEPLPESAAEWQRWLTSSRDDDGEDSISSFEEQQFTLTLKGVAFSKELYVGLSHHQMTLLREFKKRVNRAPLRAILRYVYENYPDQTERSHIREEILGARDD